ncbi:MAG: zinc-binding alcohol dehydrogenase family protein [Verrucomicrobiota bacterium]|nr:zinc-binding alcohol dehydrogenase family protein [Verrucomicrobiota bacterium]
MKAIICEKPGNFQTIEVPEPTPSANEVILRIRKIGICGTDYHAYKGNQPFFSYPRILGHEISAEVAEDAGDFKAGESVVPVPYLHCGQCKTCKEGKTNCCPNIQTMGVHVDGGMRELMPVPARNIIRADGLDHEQIATVECLAIGAHAVRRSSLRKGEWAAVAGTGPIGIGILHFAQIAGAKTIALDVNSERLSYCKNILGVDHCVNANEEPINALMEITEGNLPDAVYDATGSPKAIESAFEYVGHGGRLILVSIVKGKLSFEDPLFHAREMSLLSSRNATHEDFSNVMRALREQQIDINPFVTHRCNFDQLPSTFEDWSDPRSRVIKGMVTL